MPAFANRVALITGAGGGLGRHLALALAREGAAIAALDLKEDGLKQLSAELAPGRVACALGDVTDRTSLQSAVAELEQQLGPVDLLIANAGIGIETSALAFRAHDFEEQVRVNLMGVANSVEAVLPGMLQRQSGHLVGISSLASYRGLPGMLGYCASKAGVNALFDGLRIELRPRGIRVTTICPGWIHTAMTANVKPPRRMMEPADAATRIVQAIGRGREFFAFPPPAVRHVRLLRWLPCAWSDWLVNRSLRRLKS